MLGSANLITSTISVLFQPFPEARKSIFKLEEALKEGFLTPELLPVPDEAPPEIPRIQFRSRHGFSILRFTPVRIDLETNYDAQYSSDIKKCFDYISAKSENVQRALGVISPQIAFVALTIKVRWDEKSLSPADSAKQLSSKYLADEAGEGLEEFRASRTKIVDGKYYVRTTPYNFKVFQAKGAIATPFPRISYLDLVEFGLEKEIEINDRYAYNADEKYISSGVDLIAEFIRIIAPETTEA